MEFQDEMPFASDLIGRVARRMIGRTGLLPDDLHDIRQDIWLDLLERLPGYRQDRGHIRAFITQVVKHKAATILEARKAAKRGGGTPDLSLDWEMEDEDGDPFDLHETISVDEYLRRTRGTIRSEEERRDLALDVRKLIGKLPAASQAVCLLLINNDVTTVASIVGKPRSTLRDLIGVLRDIGLKDGLDIYFD